MPMPSNDDAFGQVPVVLVGSGRSGTTWVLDTIAEANGMNCIFEPLHPILGGAAQRFSNRYLVATDSEPELARFIGSILRGQHPGFWTRYRERPRRLYPSLEVVSSVSAAKHWVKRWQYVLQHHRRFRMMRGRPLIVKFIRANLMLGWIKANFPCRILHVLRHPLAVIESKMRLWEQDWDPNGPLQSYLSDPRLTADLDADWDAVRSAAASSAAAAHAAIWCIENLIPLRQAPNLGLVTTFYECLASEEAAAEWVRVISCLGLERMPSRASLTRPSQQASAATRERLFTKGRIGLIDVRSKLGEDRVADIACMLDRFDVRVYDVNRYEPINTTNLIDRKC